MTASRAPPSRGTCSGSPTSFGRLAETLGRHVGLDVDVRDLGWPRGGRIVGDTRRLRDLVELAPTPSIDAVADAGNAWVHRDLADAGLEPWQGVRRTAVAGSPAATHQLEVTAHLATAVASLREHRRYLEALSDRPVEEQARAVVAMTTGAGEDLSGRGVVRFEVFG